ncbi:MAG: flagellar export protein FliJ [Bacteriovoracaceae bacterium]
MKKYQFRLEPVLKVRRFKEETCRMELGQLISALNVIENQLHHDRGEIENYYKIQESGLKVGMNAQQLQAFPMLVMAKEKNIQLLLRDKAKQEQLIEEKKQELAFLRGELKVVEKLKEKDYDEYKKALNKEIDQKVEEQTQLWLQHRKV